MSNLKFRAWNKIVKRYQYFTLPELVEIKETIQWHNLVIEQSVELQDVNGTEVYEGDVLKSKKTGNTVVAHRKTFFHICTLSFGLIFEIVGNIHEKRAC